MIKNCFVVLQIFKKQFTILRYLYAIFSDTVITSNRTPVLILCNKQDHALAKGPQVIQSQLEKEM